MTHSGARKHLCPSQPARLNPKLAKYGDKPDLIRARKAKASKIVATASGDRRVGYDGVRTTDEIPGEDLESSRG